MKKILIFSLVFLLAASVYAQKQDSETVVNQLNSELEKAGSFAPEDLKPIKEPMKNMLDKGATKRDLKKVLNDLSGKGVKGKDLKKTVDSMNDLVQKGESPRQVGNIVSQAAHQALAQGLKGKDLAAKVHEAIRQRKMEREELKREHKHKSMEGQKPDKEKVKGPSAGKPSIHPGRGRNK